MIENALALVVMVSLVFLTIVVGLDRQRSFLFRLAIAGPSILLAIALIPVATS